MSVASDYCIHLVRESGVVHALVNQPHDNVSLSALLQALCLCVSRGHWVGKANALDAVWRNELRGRVGHGTDIPDLHAALFDDLRGSELCALNVRAQVGELCQLVAVHTNPAFEVLPPLVELVVTYCGGLQPHLVQCLDGGLVFQN